MIIAPRSAFCRHVKVSVQPSVLTIRQAPTGCSTLERIHIARKVIGIVPVQPVIKCQTGRTSIGVTVLTDDPSFQQAESPQAALTSSSSDRKNLFVSSLKGTAPGCASIPALQVSSGRLRSPMPIVWSVLASNRDGNGLTNVWQVQSLTRCGISNPVLLLLCCFGTLRLRLFVGTLCILRGGTMVIDARISTDHPRGRRVFSLLRLCAQYCSPCTGAFFAYEIPSIVFVLL